MQQRRLRDSFGNAADNQPAVEITIAKGKLNVMVTVTVDARKQLRLKATVPESGYLKQFGPLPVE